ncbi:hypothetical protein [Citrobacter sp. BDA59-3]|uniref:hypothetical protein n=1 Tax=Citrobacter sp. BDA59-3 TaxID=2781952 RepID=UPI00187EDD59|nr:hypothetical protein [Citrobacter sp. BDA59-3]QOV69916.1 hypothetical protein IP582_05785 [Citrobacter sp. BDA59-3]
MKIGKIIKNISFTFSKTFSVLAPSAIDNHMKQKNGKKRRIKINILFQTLKNVMIIITPPQNLATYRPATKWKCNNGEEFLR